MKHLFIPYPLAVIAKEKGFNEPCLAYFTEDIKNLMGCKDEQQYRVLGFSTYRNSEGDAISAPLYQQIIDWFREKHNWSIEITYTNSFKDYRGTIYPMFPNTQVHFVEKDKDYYEVLNKAIEEAFKLI